MRKVNVTLMGFSKILFSSTLILVLLQGCSLERDTVVSVEGGNPHTFRLTGSGRQNFLLVREVSPEEIKDPNRLPAEPEYLWELWPKGPTLPPADSWPPITYGTVPPDFEQLIPSDGGKPKPLEEGKTYLAGGAASSANGGAVYFKIENGKPREIRQSRP